ncbi:MAG TPA: hypothetical protein VD815_03025 [Candidatus Saccharimonadales bacterium]|nr:hypothetical protein [Candidatus Saccharimonadales bacterium]
MRSGNSPILSIPGGPFAISLTQIFNFPDVTANSRVVASISEVDSNGKPFIGDATLSIDRVAPNDDGEIVVNVTNTYDARVFYRVTLFVSP